jgi:hypothetical protein
MPDEVSRHVALSQKRTNSIYQQCIDINIRSLDGVWFNLNIQISTTCYRFFDGCHKDHCLMYRNNSNALVSRKKKN